jgi:hypothetical protein
MPFVLTTVQQFKSINHFIKNINLIIELIMSKTSLIPVKYGIEEITSALPLGGVGGFDDRTNIIVRIKLAIDGILQIIL